MNKIKAFLVFFLPVAIMVLWSVAAYAQGTPTPEGEGGGCTAGTLGGVICNLLISSTKLPAVLTGLSYLVGLFFGVSAVLKLQEHVEGSGQVSIWDPVKRFAAGGAFFALPMVVEVAYNTLARSGTVDIYSVSGFAGKTSGTGLDAMVVALMADVWDWVWFLLVGFSYVAGIILLMVAISRLLKTEQEGARGPLGVGTFVTFVIAGALLSMNKMIAALSVSLFSSPVVKTQAKLVYDAGLEGAEKEHALAVISAVIAFVALLGWVSFIRGLFIMRGVAEGDSQASAMAGGTHLLGGALAINLGPMLNAVQTTLGITSYGITFS